MDVEKIYELLSECNKGELKEIIDRCHVLKTLGPSETDVKDCKNELLFWEVLQIGWKEQGLGNLPNFWTFSKNFHHLYPVYMEDFHHIDDFLNAYIEGFTNKATPIKVHIYKVIASCIVQRLKAAGIEVSLRTFCYNVKWVTTAVELQFPGYAKAGLLCALLIPEQENDAKSKAKRTGRSSKSASV